MTTLFSDLPDNESLKSSLRQALRDRFPQAILLTGVMGSGKHTLAGILAAALLCKEQHDPPCGRCSSCHKIASDIHPDVECIDLGDETIKIELARTLRRWVSVLPNDGARKVAIIHQAHRLNSYAQNALLKVLEEPPRYAFFILTSDNANGLLPTIRSRCTQYRLAPPSGTVLGEQQDALLPALQAYLSALASGQELDLLRAALLTDKLDRRMRRAFLLALQTALRDAVFHYHALPGEMLLPALSHETAALAHILPPERLLRLFDFLGELAERLNFNAAAAATTSALCAGSYQICYL